ncbi:hypothetical protein LJJ44_07025 [Pseudomonas sp. B24_DOA]|nr:hypothetical protein LJJ44_07025 [Pseudomonas sp. B24_DOA]
MSDLAKGSYFMSRSLFVVEDCAKRRATLQEQQAVWSALRIAPPRSASMLGRINAQLWSRHHVLHVHHPALAGR